MTNIMNTKLAIASIVVIAVALGLYFYSPEAKAPTSEQPSVTDDIPEAEAATEAAEESTTTPREPETPTNQDPAPTQATYDQTPPEPKSTTIDLPYNKIITYDGKQFVPEEVTIVEGDTVRFVNLSDEEDMWIASNNHPTHTIYPIKSENNCSGNSFDQCEAVGLGGSWNFTFERFGDWSFHNHVRAKDTGTVHVLHPNDA